MKLVYLLCFLSLSAFAERIVKYECTGLCRYEYALTGLDPAETSRGWKDSLGAARIEMLTACESKCNNTRFLNCHIADCGCVATHYQFTGSGSNNGYALVGSQEVACTLPPPPPRPTPLRRP